VRLPELDPALARPMALALAPLLLAQSRLLLRSIPTMAPPTGPEHGRLPADGPPLSLLVIGESTAAAIGVDSHEEALTGRLAARLRRDGYDVTWRAMGRLGYGAALTRRRLVPRVQGRHDVIVVMLGVNDAFSVVSVDSWRADLLAIVQALEGQLTDRGRIYLTGVPPVASFPRLRHPLRLIIGLHGQALTRVQRQLAGASPRVVFVPTPAMVGLADLAQDKFHPSAGGYAQWAALVRQHLILP
jgi:lysophospholipase L1-like esterase